MITANEMNEKARQAHRSGDFELALKSYQQAAEAARAADDDFELAHALRHIGEIAARLQHIDEAQAAAGEALDIYQSYDDTNPLDLANAHRVAALADEAAGDQTMATAHWHAARGLYAELDIQPGVEECNRRLQLTASR